MITDFLVIGSGVAGLRAAIELADHGKVIIVTKDVPTESSTEYAQGGVAVALSDEDEVGIHFEDTIKAGDGLCKRGAVKVLVEEGPRRISELIEWGAEFDREGPKLAFTMEAAHSRRRILHSKGDSTGKELERVLISKARSIKNIERLPFSTATDLVVEQDTCMGGHVISASDSVYIEAKSTVLATGGAGQIYSRTTNPAVATGDGMAMAYRAGAILEDMEFVQFHPTALFIPPAPHFLLSEAMRGEGALLRNKTGELFMKRYHPDAELAPRDVVSRAIMSEMTATGTDHVYLDLRHLGSEFIKNRFPRIYSTCLQYSVDITADMVPVSPAAHYIMGGVRTDRNGCTSIRGLYAAGEVACTGVHGANRLASNSLLEGLVYGYRAGQSAAARRLGRTAGKDLSSTGSSPDPAIPSNALAESDSIRQRLRDIMWKDAGIIRSKTSLNEVIEGLSRWDFILGMDFTSRRDLELKNMLTVALIIVKAASRRKESIGAHYRSDFPSQGKGPLKHSISKKTGAR
ncbi:MAG: L-aspartate oxidase [Nitrospirae bacterium]|nr:L-aspartate oxidase [Nitrospirota bacterium]